jgi:hypothetical protein
MPRRNRTPIANGQARAPRKRRPKAPDGSTARPSDARVFLLSPANCSGERAQLLFSDRAGFPLARRLRSPEGAELGETFAFLSGLYFRGKLAYARRFAAPPPTMGAADAVLVITPVAGLLPAETRIDLDLLRAFREVDIDAANPRYRVPLERDVHAVARRIGDASVVLLGSIATGKYLEVLTGLLGERLLFPREFVGRGAMSRGGLLLRCASAGQELEYLPVAGAVRHGPRPPRLPPLRSRR